MADQKDTKEVTAAAEGDKQASEQPKYMTAEEFNKAATAREKRMLEKIQELMATKSASKAEAVDEDEDEEEEKEEKPAKPSPADLAAKKALAKAKELERAMKKKEEEAEKQLAEARDREERTAMLSALQAAGVNSTKHALAALKAENRIRRNKDGDLVFVVSKEAMGEKYEEETPLDQGIKEWLDSPDGKIFQPPKGVEGSGATAPKGRRSTASMTAAERKNAAGQTLLNWALGRRDQ